MTQELYETPPISGEQVPYKDMQPEQAVTPQSKSRSARLQTSATDTSSSLKKYVVVLSIIVAVIIMILLGVIVLLVRPQQQVPIPTVSPTPTATVQAVSGGLPDHVVDQVDTLEQDVTDVDL